MAQENRLKYIIPQFAKYQNVDDLLENNSHYSLFGTRENLSIDKLLEKNFVCIVGEPGIGKSRLLDEVKERISPESFYCKASEFTDLSVPKENEYCIIDALDEVEGYLFYNVLQSIKHYKKENPKVKVLFTCRKHYVASYARHFADCNYLTFIEICRLSERDVMNVISGNCNCSEATLENINKSPKLKELITIPRYLTFLLEYIKQKGECLNIGELFEYMIVCSIKAAIEAHKGIQNTESIRILLQRLLEKMAFVMEISRKDQISKDELYTILDGIKGNMTQMFIANFDLLYFESRILKDTDGTLQFENTELQEYLAAKELCRQDNIESVLYDVAVHKELKHIYPNWYDVIPHISYSKDRIHTFINVFKLIISYESNLENESFRNLLKYIDPSVLSIQQKEELFSIIFEHYQCVPAYIMWKSSMSNLLQECYTTNCDTQIILSHDKLNKIQLSNVTVTLDAIVEAKKHSDGIYNHWRQAANYLIGTDDNENKLAALNLYNALKCVDELIQVSESYSYFTKKLKEKYCEVTGYMRIADNRVVDCWLKDCYVSNPYAINAVLYIEDLPTLIYAYNRIIEDRKLYEFFNEKGSLSVFYDLHLKQQFDIAWKGNAESKKLITRIIAGLISNQSYTTHSEINVIIKQILLDETAGNLFITNFERIWDLEDLFRRFDAGLIDIELISSLKNSLLGAKIEDWRIERILINLINKIRNDANKKDSIVEYIERYAETFKRWDQESSETEDKKVNYHDQQLIKIYETLSDPEVLISDKYEIALKLSDNTEFVKGQDPQPLIEVIKAFFEELDLDQMILERNTPNSFTLPRSLLKIPAFVKVLYHLGVLDLLKKYRIILIKTLPNIHITSNYDNHEIKEIYKSVIEDISDEEKNQLVKWWQERKDDFMNISPDDICTCISDYGIDALYYKLEEYIEQYIKHPDLDHHIPASNALEIISKGNYGWDIDRYKKLFSLLKDDSITSIKMQCNAIMIEKFQDSEAIAWRIDYLKKNIVIPSRNETGEFHPISHEEFEVLSTTPHMFRCFMGIKEHEFLEKQMLILFDCGLKLCVNPDTIQYAYYLLNQTYLFFVNLHKINYISQLRGKIEALNATNVSYMATNIMNNAEMLFLKNEKANIGNAIKQYNKCIEESYLSIRNDGDLRRYFGLIYYEVQKEIQDQGIYTLVRPEALSEDFIQRELKNTIINKCCQMGLETIRVDREVALQDNKRTDLLIRYGLCNPIMVELKLLHNNEIQQDKKRHKYKEKFIQYINATNPCLSVFWVFDVHKGGNPSKFDELKEEYKDIVHTSVLLTDCKCSSIETGMSEK